MTNYLVELAVVHVSMTLAYWFFLRKERQYATLRFYLLGSVLLGLSIPLFKLPRLFGSEGGVVVMYPDVVSPGPASLRPVIDESIWSADLLMFLYLLISAFFLCKFLYNLSFMFYLRLKNKWERSGQVYIHRIHGKVSFSFFNWIFLGEEIDKDDLTYQVMLEHEKAHASLGHTFDIIFLQLFEASFWWLPSAWYVKKEIKKIHEYQADAYVLQSFSVDEYSSILISSTLKLNGLGLVSSFHDGLVLKRLKAMRQQTKKVNPWKLGALSALCAALFTALACSEEQKPDATDNLTDNSNTDIFVVVEKMPEAKGGMQAFHSYLKSEIDYPSEALKKRVEGRVDAQFIVDKDGSLSDVKVINGIGSGCDEEAVRAIRSSPSFSPASQGGKAVRVRMMASLIFNVGEGNDAKGVISVVNVQPVKNNFKVDAQYNDGEWVGTVLDEEGEGLPGVNIWVAETTTGTISDLNGIFKIKADQTRDLYLSFVGYESIKLSNKEGSR